MIIITGTITMDPQHLESAMPAIAALEQASNEEDGCVSYGWWQSATRPGHFRVYEEWESDDAVNAHTASPHMANFMAAAGGFGITAIEFWRLDGAERSRFM